MKQDIAEFLVDSFIDYKGDEHKVVLCALSQTPEKNIDDEVVEIAANKWYGALVPKHWSTNIDTIDFRLNGVQYKGGH